MVYIHKITGQNLELKKQYGEVGVFFNIENGHRIENGMTCKGKISYKISVCAMENIKKEV